MPWPRPGNVCGRRRPLVAPGRPDSSGLAALRCGSGTSTAGRASVVGTKRLLGHLADFGQADWGALGRLVVPVPGDVLVPAVTEGRDDGERLAGDAHGQRVPRRCRAGPRPASLTGPLVCRGTVSPATRRRCCGCRRHRPHPERARSSLDHRLPGSSPPPPGCWVSPATSVPRRMSAPSHFARYSRTRSVSYCGVTSRYGKRSAAWTGQAPRRRRTGVREPACRWRRARPRCRGRPVVPGSWRVRRTRVSSDRPVDARIPCSSPRPR